jgi:hypothetical protein
VATLVTALTDATAVAAASPAPLTRDGAAGSARHELAKAPYHRSDPSFAQRALNWLIKHLIDLVNRASGHAPGHGLGVGLILVLVAIAVVAVVLRVGPLRRPASAHEPVFGGTERTAVDHRRQADTYAAEGQWALAVRERLRAIGRELEQRGVIDPRPGRTADELCAEAAWQLPDLGSDLRAGAATFDSIWYGGTTAGQADDELLRALDRRLLAASRQPVPR